MTWDGHISPFGADIQGRTRRRRWFSWLLIFMCCHEQYLLPNLHWYVQARGEAGSVYGILIDICASIWHGNCPGPAWEEASACQVPSCIWNHLNHSLLFFFFSPLSQFFFFLMMTNWQLWIWDRKVTRMSVRDRRSDRKIRTRGNTLYCSSREPKLGRFSAPILAGHSHL